MPKATPKATPPPKAPGKPMHYKRRYFWAGYHTSRWRKARKAYLQDHPSCIRCEEQGKVSQAVVVDHIEPISTGVDPWAQDNWQGLCTYHDAQKRGQTSHQQKRG